MLHKLPKLFKTLSPKTVDAGTQTLGLNLGEEEMQTYFTVSGKLITGNGIIQLNNQADQADQANPLEQLSANALQESQEQALKPDNNHKIDKSSEWFDIDQAIQDALASALEDPEDDPLDNILQISANVLGDYPSYPSQWCTDYFVPPIFGACKQSYYTTQDNKGFTKKIIKGSTDSIDPDAVADSNIEALKLISS